VKSGEEPRLAYNRVLLSSVLASEVRRERHFTEAGGLVERRSRRPRRYRGQYWL
jgi:NAD(P)H-nitrite reductase large subunit